MNTNQTTARNEHGEFAESTKFTGSSKPVVRKPKQSTSLSSDVTKVPCQLCEEKDKEIKKLDEFLKKALDTLDDFTRHYRKTSTEFNALVKIAKKTARNARTG